MAGSAARGRLSAAPHPRQVRFDVAGAADDAAVRELLRAQPMSGRVRATLEREPRAALAAAIEGDRHHTVVARDVEGRVVGMGSRAVRDLWVAGDRVRVGYLGQLRRLPGLQSRMRLLARGFEAMQAARLPDEAPYDLTTIVADNLPARRLLERGLPGFPTYRSLCRLTSLTFPVPRRSRAGPVRVRPATAELLPAIARCLQRNLRRRDYAPVWTADDLDDDERCRDLAPGDFHVVEGEGRVVGCIALWDQRRFKQVRVHGYGGALRYARPVHDSVAPLLGRPPLPRPGAVMSQAYLSHVAVDDDDPGRLVELLDAAVEAAARRGIDYLVFGAASDDPWLPIVRRRYGGYAYASVLYAVVPAGAGCGVDVHVPGRTGVEVATL